MKSQCKQLMARKVQSDTQPITDQAPAMGRWVDVSIESLERLGAVLFWAQVLAVVL
jgi:hypothetical protein